MFLQKQFISSSFGENRSPSILRVSVNDFVFSLDHREENNNTKQTRGERSL